MPNHDSSFFTKTPGQIQTASTKQITAKKIEHENSFSQNKVGIQINPLNTSTKKIRCRNEFPKKRVFFLKDGQKTSRVDWSQIVSTIS